MSMTEINSSSVRDIMRSLEFSIDVAALKDDVPLVEQGVDSLDFVNLMFRIEQGYRIKMSDTEVDSANTINAIVCLVGSKLAAKA